MTKTRVGPVPATYVLHKQEKKKKDKITKDQIMLKFRSPQMQLASAGVASHAIH